MRKSAVLSVTAAVLAGTLAGLPSASADGVSVRLPITGTTTLANGLAGKPTLTLPEGSQIRGVLDLGKSTVVGTMEVPPLKAKVRALGIPVIGDTTSTVNLEPEGTTNAKIGADGYITAETSFRIALPDVRSDLPLLDRLNLGGPTCKTGLITTTLTSGAPFSLSDAIPMSATFTVPKLSGCPKVLGISLNDALLSGLLAGKGNTLDLMVGPVQNDTATPAPKPKPKAKPKPTWAVKAAAAPRRIQYGKRGKVRVTVRSRPAGAVAGKIRITKGKRTLAAKRLRKVNGKGKATLVLRKKSLRPGKHTLRVIYVRGGKVTKRTTIKVVVRNRH